MPFVDPPMSVQHATSWVSHQLQRRYGVEIVPQSEFDRLPEQGDRGVRSKNTVRFSSATVYDDSSPEATLRSLLELLVSVDPSGMQGDLAYQLACEAGKRAGAELKAMAGPTQSDDGSWWFRGTRVPTPEGKAEKP